MMRTSRRPSSPSGTTSVSASTALEKAINSGANWSAGLNFLVRVPLAVESSSVRTVRVRTWEREGKVHLEVSDSGPGIDPAIQGRLFEPFVTTKENGRGTGLGLSICKQIVESHGGSISVDSEPGKGARFTVALPAAA